MSRTRPTSLADARVGIVGIGNMGGAVAAGLVRAGHRAVHAFDPRAAELALPGVTVASTVGELIAGADIVFIAVKPGLVAGVADAVRVAPSKPDLVISVAAGVPLSAFDGIGCAVVRAMPNLAAKVGASTTALVANDATNGPLLALARALFDAVGTCEVLANEEQLHAFTALASSGPAIVAALLEGMTDGAVADGLPRDVAARSAAAMLAGTAALLLRGGVGPSGIKDAVMSPGGTTAAGIEALELSAGRGAALGAVRAAVARSREMSRS